MSRRDFDRDFAEEIMSRLKKLPADRAPKWGAMSAGELVPHLTHSILWSMGRREAPPFIGSWITRRLVWPAFAHGWLSIPKNVKIPIREGSANETDTLDDLHQALTDYLDAVETGALEPAQHSLFGDIGVDGWARLHVAHFEHHFKQFDL
jgi:hypothetical protein